MEKFTRIIQFWVGVDTDSLGFLYHHLSFVALTSSVNF